MAWQSLQGTLYTTPSSPLVEQSPLHASGCDLWLEASSDAQWTQHSSDCLGGAVHVRDDHCGIGGGGGEGGGVGGVVMLSVGGGQAA